ncbi:hypothetical protein ACPB9E_21760 [Streptomyces exfoliatus]|uniref:hypothetical protein n=1 Tax=Streptomyces exfoliatus TaxID=1905 RepID=UPI003C2FD1B8
MAQTMTPNTLDLTVDVEVLTAPGRDKSLEGQEIQAGGWTTTTTCWSCEWTCSGCDSECAC